MGSTFIFRINRSSIAEKQELLVKTVERSAGAAASYYTLMSIVPASYYETLEIALSENLHMLASDSGGFIFVGDATGKLLYLATEEGCYRQGRGELPLQAVNDLLEDGEYSVRSSNFYGWLSSPCYVQGSLVDSGGGVRAMVFAAVKPNNVLYHDLARTFLTITAIVLLVVLIVSIVVVRSLVSPLSSIATVARTFARGDFSARAPLPQRQDELYDLTLSFNSMADAMENTENSRRELIASVSHDLRTPMTTIGGFVDGILDGTIKEENQSKYLHIISDEIKRLSRMANSMVEVSRLESGEKDIIRSIFDMSELCRRVIISFEQKLNEKNIEVNLDIPDSQTVNGDHDSLFQVVYNLVDNAVKFTDVGGTITIFMEEKSSELKFHVVNTGGEISPEDIKKIFDRFYKSDHSRNTSGQGSGLGLYIVKTVINRHGGDVFAKSQNGKTEFIFTLPNDI